MRIECDSLGEVAVPEERYYGAQTARALIHFQIGEEQVLPQALIRAYGWIKRAAAEVNCELGYLPEEKCRWIVQAAQEIADGAFSKDFPLKIWQSGSGTQTNMNVNEVIANRAIALAGGVLGSKQPIHPNDDVNLSQSSNDTFPTAMHLAAVEILSHSLLPALLHFQEALARKAQEYHGYIKVGRTHLMDAVPLTLGQEFSGYVTQIAHALERIESSLTRLYELAIGATAVGTGLHAPAHFGEKVAARLAQWTGFPFKVADNLFAAIACHDPLVFAHGALKSLATTLIKIATDLTLMVSGPRAGLGELVAVENEPGSSIMPGKINPTQCEVMLMVAVHVIGNEAAVSIAGSRGNFELNVFKPLIIHHFLDSASLLSASLNSFRSYFLEGLKPNVEALQTGVLRSLMLVTALTPYLGYDRSAHVAQLAFHNQLTLKEAVLQLGYLSAEEFDRIVTPDKMVFPD